ncbi:uncharacterized protein LOC131929584 [Physella acuta]|uniref:uncharacterized protein LOC131929584 n=1 Tax=Physella acuta TaxID=109671 RepID=UPI0027DD64DC|nr:uncharacterized protein LOC131929584 [Physella acuta]
MLNKRLYTTNTYKSTYSSPVDYIYVDIQKIEGACGGHCNEFANKVYEEKELIQVCSAVWSFSNCLNATCENYESASYMRFLNAAKHRCAGTVIYLSGLLLAFCAILNMAATF